jgi:hypothetical protein
MDELHLGIEIRDFDLARMGFSLSVLDKANGRQTSEAYLRMTLVEMNIFLKALMADKNIQVSTRGPSTGEKLPRASMLSPTATVPPTKPSSRASSVTE